MSSWRKGRMDRGEMHIGQGTGGMEHQLSIYPARIYPFRKPATIRHMADQIKKGDEVS